MRPHLRLLACLGSLALLGLTLSAQRTRPLGSERLRETPGPELWVSGYTSEALHRFGAKDAEPQGRIPNVPGAQSVVLGPDGLYYSVAEEANEVRRYALDRLVDVFVGDDPLTPQNEAGPLNAPTAAVFGPDGDLYVASFANDRVLRYDGETGAYLGPFVPAGSGNLDGPDAGMTFGPDGNLYVPSFNSHHVLRYDGTSGAFLDRFVSGGTGGLRNPRMLLFRPNGDLWVSSWGSNRVLAFGADGEFVRELVTMTRPTGFALSPYDGDLYVTSDQSNRVNRYDVATGNRIEIFLGSGTGIQGATFLLFVDRY